MNQKAEPKKLIALSLFLVVAFVDMLKTPSLFAACDADLARLEENFCVNTANFSLAGAAPQNPLSYAWQLSETKFDLKFKTCISSGNDRTKLNDLVIVLDRSATMELADTDGNGKSRSVAIAREIIAQVSSDKQNQGLKVGVLLVSSQTSCDEYVSNGQIGCAFINPGSISDGSHKNKISNLLDAADGKYAPLGTDAASRYQTITDFISGNRFQAGPTHKITFVIISDARIYTAKADDEYAYFRTANYLAAQKKFLADFAKKRSNDYQLTFGLVGSSYNAFDAQFSSTYSNFCALNESDSDCQNPVDENEPDTWPVNNIKTKGFVEKVLLHNAQTDKSVIDLDRLSALKGAEALLNASRQGGDLIISALVDGQSHTGEISGDEVKFSDLNAGESGDIVLHLQTSTQNYTLPLDLVFEQHTIDTQAASEMVCQESSKTSSKKNKSGFAGGCGSVGSSKNSGLIWLVLAFVPLLLFFPSSAQAVLFVTGFLAIWSTNALAAETDGFNVNRNTPTVEGIGYSENGYTIAPGSIATGLFFDYASGLVRVASEENEKSEPIVDKTFTTHALFSLGLFSRVSTGFHIPFVQNETIDRRTNVDEEETASDDEIKSSSLGDSQVWLKLWLLSLGKFNLSLAPFYQVASGNKENLSGDGQSSYGGKVFVSHAFGRLATALNLGYIKRKSRSELSDARVEEKIQIQNQYSLSLAASYKLTQALSGEVSYQGLFAQEAGFKNDPRNSSEAGANLRLRSTESFYVFLGGAGGIGSGVGSPKYRAEMGLYYMPPVIKKLVATNTNSLRKRNKQP